MAKTQEPDVSDKKTIRVGLIGSGVVGSGVLEILAQHREAIEARMGARFEVRAIAVRDPSKARSDHVPRELICGDAMSVATSAEVDLVVELMGGTGLAFEVVSAALEAGKPVVTANKALVAERWQELVGLASRKGVDLYYEAAVAGGVPVIRVLRESLAGDGIKRIRGIVNGTSNYILSQMAEDAREFEEVLAQAQAAGYAEADPTLDIGGGDAAHKLAILASLAFGVHVPPSRVLTQGITRVQQLDLSFAERFGFTIKPLAVAEVSEGDAHLIDARVHPALVRRRSVLGSISGALNGVHIEGAAVGPCVLSGPGAGSLPTATSVVGDMIDVARNLLVGSQGRVPPAAGESRHATDAAFVDADLRVSRFYLRFVVRDRPGVLAQIAEVLGRNSVSVEQMMQEGRDHEGALPVHIVVLTHEAKDSDLRRAIETIDGLDPVVEATRAFPIEE